MKQRRPARVERRRAVIEFNLISADAARPSSRRRGCLSFLTPILIASALFVAHIPGLH